MIPVTLDNLAAVAVQAGALALAGAPLPWLFGIRSPHARLAYWRALLLACLLLPVLQPWIPQALPAIVPPIPAEDVTAVPGFAAAPSTGALAAPAFPRITVLEVIAAGIVARAGWFLIGLVTLARVRRRAARLDPRPGSIVDAIALARADAEFRVAATPTRPVTFGLLRPVVVVPSDFTAFSEIEQKAIACHELVHVRRCDWIRNVGDEIVRAVAWFHPAAWWLTRQVRLAREEVVDQEVVRRLGARKPYLDALLRLASPDRGSVFVPAPLFLGRSHLADRVALLLKEVRMSRPRLVLSFVAMAAVLLVTGRAAVLAFPLHAVMTAEQAGGAARPGQVTPGPKTPAQPEKPAVTKLKDVRPTFPAGSPEAPVIVKVETDVSGAVTGATPVAGSTDLADTAVAAVKQWKFSPGRPLAFLVGFNPGAGTDALGEQPPVLVGGNVRPPTKIKDVKPVYPGDAQQARVQGVVILETRIAANGAVSDARILRSVPLLDVAALEAVLAWKFAPAGFPVQMTVTVNFVLDGGPPSGVKGGVAGGVVGGVPGGVAGGVPGGVSGGVAGGVPGGVSGGVAGGVPGGVAGAEADAPKWVTLANGDRALRVGGQVKPPQKIVDVKPVYPQDAKDAKVQGVVIIEASIGPDGKVKDTKILRSVPMLDEAALEAVRQWEFTPTLINGVAQTVIMTVTVNFTLQ